METTKETLREQAAKILIDTSEGICGEYCSGSYHGNLKHPGVKGVEYHLPDELSQLVELVESYAKSKLSDLPAMQLETTKSLYTHAHQNDRITVRNELRKEILEDLNG